MATLITDYPRSEIRTGTFQYKGEVYHIDSAGNVYQWDSHDNVGGFFKSIGKVLQKVNAAPLKLVQKVASLTPITKKLAEKDILLKIEAKRVEFENKHLYDPAQVKKDLKKVLPVVAVAVATYFGFGQVAAAALSAYQQRKAKLEQMRAQAEYDQQAQAQIDAQIAATDAEIARLNNTSQTATADQKRMDQLVTQWNALNEKLVTDPANAASYNAQMTALEAEMLAIYNKSKALPPITTPDPNPPAIAIKPAPVVGEQVQGWQPVPMTATATTLQPLPLPSPTPTVAPSPAPLPQGVTASTQTMTPVSIAPGASDAVAAFFSRPGVETGPGIVDVSKPTPGTPESTASKAASWIKPALIAGASLVALAK